MTDSEKLQHVSKIQIFDFFSGPGTDNAGNPGTPIIVIEEIRKFCESRSKQRSNRPIFIFFNDISPDKIEQLKNEIPVVACKHDCCTIHYSSKPFTTALNEYLPSIRAQNSANLVIMDQFGIKEVTPDVVQNLASCSMTDILFFIPSDHINRFKDLPAFADKIHLSGRDSDYHTIHRDICGYYKEKLASIRYYLAPFSIKDGRKVHAILFGSRQLYGLKKFLDVCWDLDSNTGEANYSVDGDPAWDGAQSLFPEMNIPNKITLFENDLRHFIQAKHPNNLHMYEYVLTNGLSIKKANECLRKLQDDNWLAVESLSSQVKVRKGTFYLSYDERQPRIRFSKRAGGV